tara:strand:- start:3620 stop:6364 length:2745 start_codon:yes stop_codon:yes gene_type:complete
MAEDKGIQEPEIKSKEWSEIIAEQFSAVAWIKGLKIYFSIIGILGIWLFVGYDNSACGTIGFICLIIAYSLNVNKSKGNNNQLESKKNTDNTSDNNITNIDKEMKLEETNEKLLKKNIGLKERLEVWFFAIIGILGISAFVGDDNAACGTAGFICLIVAYSLNVKISEKINGQLKNKDNTDNTSDNNITSIDKEMKLEETNEKLLRENIELKERLEAKTKESSAGAWNGSIGAVLLFIAWGSLLLMALARTLDISENEHVLTALVVSVLLTGLVFWKKDFFFPNTNAKMHARTMIRLAYAFSYFLIFFLILMSFTGWYAPEITLIDVMLMAIFFLGSSFISVLPKYTPTKEDSKDAEFMTFFIIFTIINYTFFIMLGISLMNDYSLTVLPIIFFCILILLILSYNFILEFVKKYFLKGQNNVDDSYDFYKKEKNTGSLLYIGLISIFLFSVVPTYTVALLGSLFVISIVKTRMTDLSDWKTPLGNLTKYEFSLFTFNIVIVLACVYAIHDEIEFSRSDNEEFSNSCESLKSGDGVVRSEPTSWSSGTYSYLENCDLSYSYLSNENMRGINIGDTSFEYAILRNADLSRAQFYGDVDFTNADLSAADLSRADFSGEVNFTNANLEQANLGYTVCGRWESCNNLTFVNANLRNAIFENAYLENVNFQGADLRGAYLIDAHIFRYAVFDENTIFDKDALTGISLEGVNLSGRDFSGYNFTGTNFNGANLSGVNLSGSTLTGVSGFDLQGCPSSMPDNWICLTNNLIGPETTFRGVNFSNGNLSNKYLSNSNFSSANLRNTNFSNTNLTNSYFSYGNFDEVNDMIMWYEDDPENVTDYFGHIDFEGDFDDYLVKIKTESAADLSNANLSGANLSYVNFAYANLTNVDLSDADLTGAIWRYTICPDGINTGESGSCKSN